MKIQIETDALCRKYSTRNPFAIAKQMDVIVLHEPLGTIRGYYNQIYRHKFIHINEALDELEQLFVCAHELGHLVLHPQSNTSFLRNHTLFSIDKMESQANQFAVNLLFQDEELQPFLTRPITDAAAWMGVSIPLAQYRMALVKAGEDVTET